MVLLDDLWSISKRRGYIRKKDFYKIAKKNHLSSAELFGTITFYDGFKLEKENKHVIEVCTCPSCIVNGALSLLKLLKENIDEKKAEIVKISCLGICDRSPIVIFDGKIYEKATEKDIKKIIKNANR